MRKLWDLFEGERALFFTGLFGLGLSAVCFAAMAYHGVLVEPEGHLEKAATFDGAVGIFLLTLALIAPSAGMSRRGGRIWRFSLIGLTLFGYSVETVQVFRGLDPRFSRVGTTADQVLGGVFFLSAVGIMICFIVLTLRFFFRSINDRDGPLVLALRYGSVAALLAFGIGIAMSVRGSPRVAEAGNLLPLHAAGFHGLQAVPLVALLFRWAGRSLEDARASVHLAGILWLVACVAIAFQSFGGYSLFEPSVASALAVLALGAWAVLFTRAARAWKAAGAAW